MELTVSRREMLSFRNKKNGGDAVYKKKRITYEAEALHNNNG